MSQIRDDSVLFGKAGNPAARLNVYFSQQTPDAPTELHQFKTTQKDPVKSCFNKLYVYNCIKFTKYLTSEDSELCDGASGDYFSSCFRDSSCTSEKWACRQVSPWGMANQP